MASSSNTPSEPYVFTQEEPPSVPGISLFTPFSPTTHSSTHAPLSSKTPTPGNPSATLHSAFSEVDFSVLDPAKGKGKVGYFGVLVELGDDNDDDDIHLISKWEVLKTKPTSSARKHIIVKPSPPPQWITRGAFFKVVKKVAASRKMTQQSTKHVEADQTPVNVQVDNNNDETGLESEGLVLKKLRPGTSNPNLISPLHWFPEQVYGLIYCIGEG